MDKETQVDYGGEKVVATELEFDTEKEAVGVYRLADGSTLRVKNVVMRVLKLKDKVLPNGKPIYVINVGAAIETEEADAALSVSPAPIGQR